MNTNSKRLALHPLTTAGAKRKALALKRYTGLTAAEQASQ